MTVKLFVLDDDPVYRAGVIAAVGTDRDLKVVGEQSFSGNARANPAGIPGDSDVVLFGAPDPVARAGIIAALGPPGARVLVVSADNSAAAIVTALRAGAMGYLTKSATAEELVRAVHILAQGGAAFGPGAAEELRCSLGLVPRLSSRLAFPSLTERERDILELVAQGWGNRRIARRLLLAEKTVRNHLTSMFRKLGVSDRIGAMTLARAAGVGIETTSVRPAEMRTQVPVR